MSRSRRKAYTGTGVSVSKSRDEIDGILKAWGVVGIQWEDDLEGDIVNLRFRWKREDDSQLVARFSISLEGDEEIRELAIDGRSGKFSENKYEKLKQEQGKREHRLLANFLKNAFEAIEQGIIPAEALLMPWLEDSSGKTLYDRIEPIMGQLASQPLHKALAAAKDE